MALETTEASSSDHQVIQRILEATEDGQPTIGEQLPLQRTLARRLGSRCNFTHEALRNAGARR